MELSIEKEGSLIENDDVYWEMVMFYWKRGRLLGNGDVLLGMRMFIWE